MLQVMSLYPFCVSLAYALGKLQPSPVHPVLGSGGEGQKRHAATQRGRRSRGDQPTYVYVQYAHRAAVYTMLLNNTIFKWHGMKEHGYM